MCVHMPVEDRGQLPEVSFLLLSGRIWGLNSAHNAWQLALGPASDSVDAGIFNYFMNIIESPDCCYFISINLVQ